MGMFGIGASRYSSRGLEKMRPQIIISLMDYHAANTSRQYGKYRTKQVLVCKVCDAKTNLVHYNETGFTAQCRYSEESWHGELAGLLVECNQTTGLIIKSFLEDHIAEIKEKANIANDVLGNIDKTQEVSFANLPLHMVSLGSAVREDHLAEWYTEAIK